MNGIIYLITNLINGHKYVGQTYMKLSDRWDKHVSDMNCGRETSLYRAMRKYGITNFKITVLETCPIEQLDEREIYWISFYNTFHDGYNETLGGQNQKPFFSEQDLDRLNELYRQGYSHLTLSKLFNCSPETIVKHLKYDIERDHMGKTICQIDPDTGRILTIYPSTVAANDACGGTIRGHLNEVCTGRALTAGGYYWQFATGNEQVGDKVQLPSNMKDRMVVRTVYQYTLDRHLVANYPSVIAAARALGAASKRKDISEACRGLKKRIDPHHYNGFLWYFD